MYDVRTVTCRLLGKRGTWCSKSRNFNDYIAEFEHSYEEEVCSKEKKNNALVVKANSNKADELSKDELRGILNKRIVKEKNDKLKYAIKTKNRMDKDIRQLYGSIVVSLVIMLYVLIANYLFDEEVYKFLFTIINVFEIIIIITALRNINIVKSNRQKLARYFDNDILLKKYSFTYLYEVDNKYKELVEKAKAYKQIIKKDSYILYKIKKLTEEKKGDIGIAVFITLLSMFFWIILLVSPITYVYKFIMWLFLSLLIVVLYLIVNDYIENNINICILKTTKRYQNIYDNKKGLFKGKIKNEIKRKLIIDYEVERIDRILDGVVFTKEEYVKEKLYDMRKNRLEARLKFLLGLFSLGIIMYFFGIIKMNLIFKISGSVSSIIILIIFLIMCSRKNNYNNKIQALKELLEYRH